MKKTRMFITLLHLFITLYLLFVNDTIKEWGLIVYTLLYYTYYLFVSWFYNYFISNSLHLVSLTLSLKLCLQYIFFKVHLYLQTSPNEETECNL